ncbi:ABC transporter permease subunit [Paenibacillus sp. GP183]|uniref:ABC transporter permease n=1 Tax=Paenibacillus sp. GP183 TaxID=1882751 RepID=UPI00089B882D|nr:ABC transporter permease subunit [Paenibacillus sp. GP183]SEB98479.1 putative spermidine/putrescine transport system permease protein [Paenibacillus sp. GP183]
MKNRVPSKLLLLAVLLPFFILIVGFELLPTATLVINSFLSDKGDQFTMQQYFTSLTNPFYLKAIRNSLLISLYSSVAGIIMSLLLAYAITRASERTRNFVLMISNMTSNFAGLPLAFAYIILLGNNGVLTILFKTWGWSLFAGFDLYTWTGLAFVYVYFQLPLGALLLYPTLYGMREQWWEAASLLGANMWQFARRIALPVLLPGIAGTFTILFANSMGAYATAYALVGGNYNLLAIRIGSLVAGNVVTRPQLGCALAVLLGGTMVLAMWLNDRLMRKVRRDLQ